ncbi:unnamed protein product, partial [Plutella xylostella]
MNNPIHTCHILPLSSTTCVIRPHRNHIATTTQPHRNGNAATRRRHRGNLFSVLTAYDHVGTTSQRQRQHNHIDILSLPQRYCKKPLFQVTTQLFLSVPHHHSTQHLPKKILTAENKDCVCCRYFSLVCLKSAMWGLALSFLGWVGLSPTPYIASAIGATDPAIKLFLSILMGYPLAIVYHKHIRQNPEWRNPYFIITGLDMAWYNFGPTLYHNMIPVVVIYLTSVFLGPGKINCIITFVFNMTYLLAGYIGTESEDYDITWTMPHCVLTLKLIALS